MTVAPTRAPDALVRVIGTVPDPAVLASVLDRSVADLPGADQDRALVAALRATRPHTESWLRDHGATAEQAADSTADVDRKLERYGLRATGLDWFCSILTGRVVTVGRLQFEIGDTRPDGRPAWGVHVPESGPLDPDACDRSFAEAPAVLRRLAPRDAADHWQCRSWMLDPGLPEALGPEANLVRFAGRFRLDPPGNADTREGDDSVAKFVLTSGTRGGRLAAAVAERHAAGGHWTVRTGAAPVA